MRQHDIPLSLEVRIYVWQSKAAQRVIALLQKLHSLSSVNHLREEDINSLGGTLGFVVENDDEKREMVNNIVRTFAQWKVLLYSHGPLALWQKILNNQCYGSFHIASYHLSNYLEEIAQLFEKLQVWWKEGDIDIEAWLAKIQTNIHLEESHISQNQAIRLMTVHRAKGLEAPIVICPDLWYGGMNRTNPFTDHLAYSARKQHYILMEKADLAAKKIEAHRLLYVALTRARSKLLLYWIPYKHRGEVNSLETLLFIKAMKGDVNGEIDEESNLQRLSAISGLMLLRGKEKLLANIENTYRKEKVISASNKMSALDKATPIERKQHTGLWSFTRLHRTQYYEINEEYEKDKEIEIAWQSRVYENLKGNFSKAVSSNKYFISATQLGTLVHKLIENILVRRTVTQKDLAEQIEQQSQRLLQSLNIKPEQRDAVQKTLSLLSHATLSCALSSLDSEETYPLYSSFWQKFCEVRFDIKINHWQIEKLNELCSLYPNLPIAPLNSLTIDDSLFYGFIDLVLSPRSKEASPMIWIVDFKTNFLGEEAMDYCYEKMHKAMFDSHYGWQALFYALSIYRWTQSVTNTSSKLPIKIMYLFSRGLALESKAPELAEQNIGRYVLDVPQELLVKISTILS